MCALGSSSAGRAVPLQSKKWLASSAVSSSTIPWLTGSFCSWTTGLCISIPRCWITSPSIVLASPWCLSPPLLASPNPMEKVWLNLYRERLYHHPYDDDWEALQQAVEDWLGQYTVDSQDLLRSV